MVVDPAFHQIKRPSAVVFTYFAAGGRRRVGVGLAVCSVLHLTLSLYGAQVFLIKTKMKIFTLIPREPPPRNQRLARPIINPPELQ
jgi:hypothetical protein